MKIRSQKGFSLITLLILGLIVGGMGFMYWKGYRLDIKTESGAGPAVAERPDGGGQQTARPDGFYYTVQVSVTPVEENAMNLVHDLRNDGYDAYYDTYETSRGRMYKIRLGQYADKQSAVAVKSQVRRRYNQFKDSFIRFINE